jgi:hypothetical protein
MTQITSIIVMLNICFINLVVEIANKLTWKIPYFWKNSSNT